MAQIPLNKFVRKIAQLGTFTSNIQPIYVCPSQRATIILTVQSANVSNNTATISIGVSSIDDKTLYFLASGYPVPVKDSVNVTLGKVLLIAGDSIVIFSDTPNAIHTSLSLLEAFNEN
jgi:hypothetical protein